MTDKNMACEVKSEKKQFKYVVSKIFFICIGILMLLHILWLIVPVVWGLMASFKDPYDFSVDPFSWPDIFCWENYSIAFNALEVEVWIQATQKLVSYNYLNMFWNSILFAVLSPLWGLFVTYCTAYLIARYRFTGRNLIYNFAVLMMVLPFSASLSASLYLRKILGVYDNMFLHILTGPTGFGFNFILLYGNIRGLTNSYGEAAQIDGAGHYTIMLKIYLPMVLPLLFGLFLLAFINAWNDYNTFLVYLPSTPNLSYGTYAFNQFAVSKRYTTPQVMAAFMLLALPTIVFWCVCQKWTMQTMKVGGLKG